MGRRVSIIIVSATALVLSSSAATAAPLAPEPLSVDGLSAPQTLATPPLSRTGTLDIRPTGFPQSDDPARQMVSATVTQDLRAGRVSGTVTLGAAPVPANESFLGIDFGHIENGGCVGEFGTGSYTTPPTNPGYTFNGPTVTFDVPSELAKTGQWSCAFAFLYPPGAIGTPTLAYDGLAGTLVDVNGKPQLAISGVELDGEHVKKLKLESGAKTTIDVTVSNKGEGDAGEVFIYGDGKGLKVKKGTVPALDAGSEVSASLKVKVAKNAPGKTALKLTALSPDLKAKQKIKVKVAGS